jgi:hypothetical protein
MKKQILFIIAIQLFSWSLLAQVPTLVISDIDDTIKMTHVNSSEKYSEGLRTDNPFHLMSELYQSMDARFYYVSNAPESLAGGAHRGLLSKNKFPVGQVYLRDGIFTKPDKLPILRKILLKEKPSFVVLIGDDGEADGETYAKIESEFSGIRFLTFIRRNYNLPGKIKPNQIPFVAAGELSIYLYRVGLIKEEKVPALIQASAMDLRLPVWTYCKGHAPKFQVPLEWRIWTDKMSDAILVRCL